MTKIDSARQAASMPRRRPRSNQSASSSRHAEFDALRGTAILLVMTVHAALAYTRFDFPRLLWGVREPSTHLAFDGFCWWSMSVSVSLFFAMSGFFAAKLERSRGPVEFLKGRFRRVVVPMLAAAPIVLPLCFFAWSGGWLASGRATPHEWWRMRFDDPAIMSELYGPAHLWFLEYLIPMLLVFGLWRKGRLDRDARKAKIRADLIAKAKKIQAGRGLRRKKVRADHAARRSGESDEMDDEQTGRDWLLSPWAPLVLATPTVLLLILSRAVTGIDAALDRHNSFFPGSIRLLHYGTFFAFGVGLYRARGQLDALSDRAWWYWLASIPAFAVRAWLLRLDWSSPLDGPGAFALAASGGLTTWLTLFGLLGVYRKYLNRPSTTIRYLAEASFWIYLAHLPIVGLIQLVLLHQPIPTVAKFAITWSLTLALGIASYHVLVRRKALGRFLNGGFQVPKRRVGGPTIGSSMVNGTMIDGRKKDFRGRSSTIVPLTILDSAERSPA